MAKLDQKNDKKNKLGLTRRLRALGVVCSTLLSLPTTLVSSHSVRANPVRPMAIAKGSVLAGDYPDQSVIRVDSTYYATSTTSGWAPAFSIFTSTDLVNWKIKGAVFDVVPTWTDGSYWAPEIRKVDQSYAVYYTARDKQTRELCVAVAKSSSPTGPYTDFGKIVCHPDGAIDPAIADDGPDHYLIWKEDANSVGLPTPIFIQKLNADGTQLEGQRHEIIRNDVPWEGNLVEAPYVLHHADYWYIIYSGNGCCGRKCDYAVGVARSKDLSGPWEKFAANPILKGNDDWRCPGHGSVVQDPDGRDLFLYHSYNKTDSIYVGRQLMVDEIEWKADGWPSINDGHGPSSHSDGLLGNLPANNERTYKDDFQSPTLQPGWKWPYFMRPDYKVGGGKLAVKIADKSGSGTNMAARVIARATTTTDYDVLTEIDVSNLKSTSAAGLALYGSPGNAIGCSFNNSQVVVWKQFRGTQSQIGTTNSLSTLGLRGPANAADSLQIRAIVRDGHRIQFSYRTLSGGQWGTWASIGGEQDGFNLPPWDESLRMALVAGGTEKDEAIFKSFKTFPLPN